ncbi:MAG: glycoside hydrolase family 140 protein [Chitinophagaceae bacterium]
MKNFFFCIALALLVPASFVQAQFTVSQDKHYLLKNNKPFFWLGDTAWELFHRLTREEADLYLKKRSEQGFTVIQAVILAELDGLHTPNAYGALPLLNDDPAEPVEAYFEHVDYIINRAAFYQLNIALLPTWGDKLGKHSWGKGPEIFNTENAALYTTWLANRYKQHSNIIWVLGGDRNPRNLEDAAIWRAMGKAIQTATANKALITFHPQPNNEGSAEWFHTEPWLSFNMFQTGHCRDGAVYDKIGKVYAKEPIKPVLDGEPIYEDHPVCFNVTDLGTSNAYDVRKAAYLALFAGAHGHTYGCHDVWQMYTTAREGVNGPHLPWQQALDLPGASQMKHVRKLMESQPLEGRVPDQTLLKEQHTVPAERIQATRGAHFLFVYTAAGKPFTVVLGKLKADSLRASWYNPRSGNHTAIHTIPNKGMKLYKPPTSGYGQDWILVLEDPAHPARS